jgi:hypothetical protein
MSSLKMGQKARDVVTGFEGIVVARVSFLTGCDRYALLPQGLNKDGRPFEEQYFDVNRLQLIDGEIIELPGSVARDPDNFIPG